MMTVQDMLESIEATMERGVTFEPTRADLLRLHAWLSELQERRNAQECRRKRRIING